jgi:Uncharacterized conserved protein containing a ferredoxin-like domain
VKIEIPKLLLDLRSDVVEKNSAPLERLAYRVFAWIMTHPAVFRTAGKLAALFAPRGPRWIRNLPLAPGPIRAWLQERDLPPPAPRSFHRLWSERK